MTRLPSLPAIAVAMVLMLGGFIVAVSPAVVRAQVPGATGLVSSEPPLGATLATSAVSTAATVATPAPVSPKPTPKPKLAGEELGLVKLFKKGGPVMWPLLAALVIAIGFVIERTISLGRARINVRDFMSQISALVQRGDWQAAMALCERTRGPVAAVIKAGLSKWEKGGREVEKAIETAGAGAMSKLERGLPVLASIANIAPLLGFLGTVTGMIRSFGVIAKAGLSNPGLVAQGISEALITTASGLIIAIPTLAAYNFFTSVVAKFALEMDESTSELLDHIR